MKRIFRHKKVLLLTSLMVIVSFLIAILSIVLLYNNAQNNIYDRLTDIVNHEKSAISFYVKNYHSSENEIIDHIKRVRKNDVSIGENGEIIFVKIENDSIRLLIYDTSKNYTYKFPRHVSNKTSMYQALQGKSGCAKGPDYKGIKVFAAYTFVEKLNWGIVAKIPTSEINRPFIGAAVLVLILSSILISICTYIFIKITNPIINSVLANDQKLKIVNKNLNDKVEELIRIEAQLEEQEKNLLLKNQKYEAVNKELKQTNEQLYTAKEKAMESENRLKELNATKDKLFFIIAHDLRSPFNGILGFSELLTESMKDHDISNTEKYIEIINSSAKSTLVLLENLLKWVKSQTGQINFNPEKIALSPAIREIIEFSNSTARIKNISINHIHPDETEVFADKNMLQTILRNLISNALKFTNSNGKIKIYTKQEGDNIKITVSDNGVGMDEETRNKLFRIDANITTKGTANETGSGLGLILCREFVEKHGGKIYVETEEGKGSDFTFTIPCYKS